MQIFDVFVIGGGPAGQTLAQRCAAGGLRVGITEHRGYGGTCALRGCDPKRVLVTRSAALQAVDQLNGHGLDGLPILNWADSRAAVAAIMNPIPLKAEDALRKSGIIVFTNEACFSAPQLLQIGTERVKAQHIVIATGMRPAPLDIPGAAFAKTSDDFHALADLPARILLIGGGYIGMETAHFCARASRKVTVINDDDDPLPTFDDDLVARFLDCTRQLGIDYQPKVKATSIEAIDDERSFRVSLRNEAGELTTLTCDLVINSAGRLPNIESLRLDKAGITPEKEGIPVDEYFRVKGSPGIYAIGDVAHSKAPPLTPVANLEAETLAKTLLGKAKEADYRGVATVIYALPELACVGLTERQAKAQGLKVEVRSFIEADHKFNAKRTGAAAYGYKVLVDNDDHIIGAHILGPMAGEQINILALAIRAGLKAELLREMPFAYPTWISDVSAMVSAPKTLKPVCSSGSEE